MQDKKLNLSGFVGEWRLSRRITDAKYGQNGRLEGVATFSDHLDGLVYFENGKLTLDSGAMMQAERGYLWGADGTGIVVRFSDGSPFHRFDPTGQAMGTSHLCGADWYNVTYDFDAWPEWSATWTVTGPRKDYTSISHYKRV